MANTDLFAYKDPSFSLDLELTLDNISQLSQSDLKALDYSFAGDEAFDGNYYLAENIDVRDSGQNPFTHYFESGASEGRDPNVGFDTSFYLEQNPDVRDTGINPFAHYFESGASEGRDPNQVFQSFNSSEGVLVASADMSSEQFNDLKDSVDDVALAPAIPIVIYKVTEVIAITAISAGLLKSAINIQEAISGSNVEVFVPEGDIDSSIPPFDLGEAGTIDPESFPNSNEFLEEILDGKFEFPDIEEGEVYFVEAGSQGNELGDLREQAVAGSLGVDLRKDINGQDLKVFEEGASEAVSIDVFGPNGELILVGGPAKVTNFSKLGQRLRDLKMIADVQGVKAQYYFSDNTSEAVIKFTEKRLGAENVFTFPEVN